MKGKVVHLRFHDRAQFQNRHGPDGESLDPNEAISWFPELDESTAGLSVSLGGRAQLAFLGMQLPNHP